jgi:putative addiction module killer protein
MVEIRKTGKYAHWFSRLRDNRAKARINIRIRRLGLGNPGDVKPVGGGISELRIDVGKGYRVYFAQRGSCVIVLLAGGDKSTQKKDIEKARELVKQL